MSSITVWRLGDPMSYKRCALLTQLTKVLYIHDEPVAQRYASDLHALFQIKPSFQTAWSLLQDIA